MQTNGATVSATVAAIDAATSEKCIRA